jgi:uncharacterized protein YdeI (YjbR/CyaY-like superfamily)
MPRVTDLPDPESPNGKERVVPGSRGEWRRWLAANPDRVEGVWVVHRKKSSDLDGPSYDDLVEEALCFGWIDSVTHRVDQDRTIQWFSPRRAGGLWSALNKKRIETLLRQGLMTEAGQKAIDQAKADGSWSQADDADALIVPADLEAAFDGAPTARVAYERLPDSSKKQYLWLVYSAKRPETRVRRVADVVRRLTEAEA